MQRIGDEREVTESLERYSRQILFSGIGIQGQRRLGQRRVVILGAGALGCSHADTLARAGVGKLDIIDRDFVEWSNLQRQQLYTEEDARQRLPKAVAAERRLKKVNSAIHIEGVVADVTEFTIEDLLAGADLVLDATDNFEVRLLLNDACQKLGMPWIFGACVGSYGLSMTVLPGRTPCLSCVLPEIPLLGATCDTVGVIAPAVQMVSAYQTAEALKLLVGETQQLRGELVSFDLWKNRQAKVNIERLQAKTCPSCGTDPSYPYLSRLGKSVRQEVLCGRDAVQFSPAAKRHIDLEALAGSLRAVGQVQSNGYLLYVAVDPYRIIVFQDGRVLIRGTNDVAEARKIYTHYLGG